MNKKLSDHISVGSDKETTKKNNKRINPKGSTQSDESNIGKKISNIHRQ